MGARYRTRRAGSSTGAGASADGLRPGEPISRGFAGDRARASATTPHAVTAPGRRSTVGRRAELVPLPRIEPDAATPTTNATPAPLRRRRSGVAASTSAALDAHACTTRSTATGSASSGKASSTCRATAARCSSRTTRARSLPTRPRSCTASRRSSGGRSTAWPSTCSARCPSSARCGRAAAASPRTPTTRTGCCTTNSSSRSCSRKARKGTGKQFSDRYQLRRFGRGGFVEIAMRAGVPVVPIAVVGAEESMPILFKSTRLAKLLNIPYFPITANMLRSARPGSSCTSPRSSRSACCRRCTSTCRPNQERYSRSRVMEESERIRRMVQDALYDMLRTAPQRLVRLSGVACASSSPGSSTYWGGRVAQALEQRRRRRGHRRARHARPAGPARTHGVRARRLVVLDPRPHRARDRDRHDPAHAPHRRLDARQRPHAARDQRDRHDEPARGRGRARQPGAQGRREELVARLRRQLSRTRTCSART